MNRNRQQILMILAIAAAGLYATDLLIIGPVGQWWSTRSQRIVTLRKQVQEGEALVKRETGIRTRWDFMRTNSLPSNTSLAEQKILSSFSSIVFNSR